ncbi:MAG: divalent cation transporter, partial [Polaribacter sp.]
MQTKLENTTLFRYNEEECKRETIEKIEELTPILHQNIIQWFNTYGKVNDEHIKGVVTQNNLDDFLLRLMKEEHTNKVIELEDILFVAIEVFRSDDNSYTTDKMAFILNSQFIWSIQEKLGDYFGWIRERLMSKKGLVRHKKADYLFFLILDSIIDNYEKTFQNIALYNDKLFSNTNIKPTPNFTSIVETRKQEIFKLKKATKALRDTVVKLEKVELKDFETKYFEELKEQTNNLIADIDFEVQELESKINLIFSIQGHQLNEIMKTLTIFSIIFIPITFLAGIYGMNFENMP